MKCGVIQKLSNESPDIAWTIQMTTNVEGASTQQFTAPFIRAVNYVCDLI